jgi:hypothetical protein
LETSGPKSRNFFKEGKLRKKYPKWNENFDRFTIHFVRPTVEMVTECNLSSVVDFNLTYVDLGRTIALRTTITQR